MKQVQQPERLNGIEYSHIGFEAECASAIIYITLNGLRSSIGNRRFKLNVTDYSVSEIMSKDVGSEGDFIISGDNAKSYLACFGENDGTFKSLECLFFNSGTNNISDDFNSFRNILLTFYNRIINGAERVKNSDNTFSASFKIGDNEFIKIVNNEQLMDLENTKFQATLTVDGVMMLRDFKHNYTQITADDIGVYYHEADFSLFNDLFDYMVGTFLYIYKNKKGNVTDKSVDRKAFVPLALRNTLSEIILNERERNLFALSVKREIIRQIGNNVGDDWIVWETLLDTYIFNMPGMLDISHIYVPGKITFEIRCFERTFLKARPIKPKQKDKKNRKKTIQKATSSRKKTTPLVNSDDEKSGKYDWLDDSDNDEEHKGGTVRRRKTQRFKKTQKRRRTYKKFNKNKLR